MPPPDEAPIADAYWVDPGTLLAGAYPVAWAGDSRLERLLAAGVTLFVDLTEAHEPLAPYADALPTHARASRHPIPDLGVVDGAAYAEILDVVDAERAGGGCVYVHCWGGIGRSGTVVGCWLARHDLAAGDPIGRIAELRRLVPDRDLPSPQTDEQRAIVAGWPRGR